MSPKTLFAAIAISLVAFGSTLSAKDNEKEAKKARAVAEATARIDAIDAMLAELASTERQVRQQLDLPASEKVVPDGKWHELLVTMRAEAIVLQKEREKLEKRRWKAETKERRMAREQLQNEADAKKHEQKENVLRAPVPAPQQKPAALQVPAPAQFVPLATTQPGGGYYTPAPSPVPDPVVPQNNDPVPSGLGRGLNWWVN